METLPDDFLMKLRELEASYCASNDPILQSGFSGGALRWKRSAVPYWKQFTNLVTYSTLVALTVYLLECLVEWAAQRGLALNHMV